MNFKRVAAMMLRQFYLIRSSFTRILPMFAWVAVDIVLWGFITRYLNAVVSRGFDFVPLFLGAVLLWDFFSRVMHGVTMAFFEDVWSRNFMNIFASPLSIAEYLTGLVGTSIATSLAGLIMMFLLAGAAFGLSFFIYGRFIVPFLIVLFLFGIALGIFSTALVLRFGPAAEWFIWPLPAILSPFACVFYPLSSLPEWMQYAAYILPPSYVFEGMRGLISGSAVFPSSLLLAGVLVIFYVLIACWYFIHVYRRALRTGLISRYTAET